MVNITRLEGAHFAYDPLAAQRLRFIGAIEVNGDAKRVQSGLDASENFLANLPSQAHSTRL